LPKKKHSSKHKKEKEQHREDKEKEKKKEKKDLDGDPTKWTAGGTTFEDPSNQEMVTAEPLTEDFSRSERFYLRLVARVN